MQGLEQLTIDENAVAFHPMMGNSYQLNEVSRDIVKMLQQQKSKDEIIEEMSQKYNVTKSELFIDVSDFLAKMKIYGLLQ